MTGGAGTGGADVKSESERAKYFIKKKVLVTFLTCLDFLLFAEIACFFFCFFFPNRQMTT